MKINFQKIIAVVVACALSVSVLCITISADSFLGASFDFACSTVSDYSDLLVDVIDLSIKYMKGYISQQEFSDLLNDITESNSNSMDNNIEQFLDRIRDIVENGGSLSDLADNIFEFLESIGVLVEIDETVENVDMRGYGVMLVTMRKDTGLKYTYWGATYAVWNPETNQCRFVSDDGIVVYGGSSDWWKERAFEQKYNSPYTTSISHEITAPYLTYQWYGDVRIGDPFDTSNDDNLPSGETADPEEDVTTDNTDGLTDEDIIKLLEELLEKLQLEFPDLSTLEGLLEAIYYKLGTLDSDNDNALLSQILVAIQALQNSGNSSNAELLTCLNEIKNTLITGEGETQQSAAELLKLIADNQLTLKDFKIDENAYLNNYEVLKVKLQNKFSFITELKTLIDTAISAYSSSTNEPKITFTAFGEQFTIDFSFLNSQLPMIQFMIAAFVYLSYAVRTYRRIPVYINGGGDE